MRPPQGFRDIQTTFGDTAACSLGLP